MWNHSKEGHMIRYRTRGLLVCAALAVLLVVPGVARADVLNDWNLLAQNEAVLIRPTAHGQTRGMAMVQGAVFDAVNALEPRYKPYLLDTAKLKAQPFGSRDAAIATAAHNVLVAIVDPARVAALDAAYAKTLEPIQAGPTKDEGVRVGAAAASAMLAARAADGYMAPFTFDLRPDAGGIALGQGEDRRHGLSLPATVRDAVRGGRGAVPLP